MDPLTVLAYAFLTAVAAIGARDWRGLWRGDGDYYVAVARGLRPSWLWGDRALLAFLRGGPALYLTSLAVLLWMVTSDLAARYAVLDAVRPGTVWLVLLAILCTGAVQACGRPRWLVAPPMRHPDGRSAVLRPEPDSPAPERPT